MYLTRISLLVLSMVSVTALGLGTCYQWIWGHYCMQVRYEDVMMVSGLWSSGMWYWAVRQIGEHFNGTCWETKLSKKCSLCTQKKKVGSLMFYWPYIIVYQYSETNVMHFLFNVLRIKALYMFQALPAHPQEVLNKWHLVYFVRCYVSWVHQDWSGTGAANWHNTHTIYQVPFV
jgi:hypothetical protein